MLPYVVYLVFSPLAIVPFYAWFKFARTSKKYR